MAEFAVEMNLEALQLSRNLRSGNAVYCRLILGRLRTRWRRGTQNPQAIQTWRSWDWFAFIDIIGTRRT